MFPFPLWHIYCGKRRHARGFQENTHIFAVQYKGISKGSKLKNKYHKKVETYVYNLYTDREKINYVSN